MSKEFDLAELPINNYYDISSDDENTGCSYTNTHSRKNIERITDVKNYSPKPKNKIEYYEKLHENKAMIVMLVAFSTMIVHPAIAFVFLPEYIRQLALRKHYFLLKLKALSSN
jgi:hypothetical protein